MALISGYSCSAMQPYLTFEDLKRKMQKEIERRERRKRRRKMKKKFKTVLLTATGIMLFAAVLKSVLAQKKHKH